MRITRRKVLSGAAAGIASAALLPRALWAASELRFGDVEITTLRDGYLTQPADFRYAPMPQEALGRWLAENGLQREAPITPPCNVTLLRSGERVVLFDAGSGPGFVSTAGQLPEALAALGIDTGDVTDIIFTHAHADHLWGVLDDFDDPVFPNAAYRMGRAEFEFWIDPHTVDTIASERVAMAVGAARRLEMLKERFLLFDDGQEVIPGVAALSTPGHTPGHMSFEIHAGSEKVTVVGDAILNEGLSVGHPDWRDGADADRDLAVQTRLSLLGRLAGEQMPMIGFHMAGGGVGRIDRYADTYRFVPA